MEKEKRVLSTEEILDKINNHKIWLASKGRKGEDADFTNCVISDFSFSAEDLTVSNFSGAYLKKCEF